MNIENLCSHGERQMSKNIYFEIQGREEQDGELVDCHSDQCTPLDDETREFLHKLLDSWLDNYENNIQHDKDSRERHKRLTETGVIHSEEAYDPSFSDAHLIIALCHVHDHDE